MKKLIILLCAVAVGFFAQAASVSWATGDIVGTNGALADDNDYDYGWTYSAIFQVFADNAGTMGAQIGSDIVGVNAYGNFKGSIDGLATGTDYWIKTIITEDQGGGVTTDMIVGPAKFTTGDSESFATSLNFTTGGGFAGGTSPMSSASWGGGGGDIPEPTSGLLLAIGGAMLALRRRR